MGRSIKVPVYQKLDTTFRKVKITKLNGDDEGCGESIKEFLTLGFGGSVLGVFGFCDLKRPHKPRLQNRMCF